MKMFPFKETHEMKTEKTKEKYYILRGKQMKTKSEGKTISMDGEK